MPPRFTDLLDQIAERSAVFRFIAGANGTELRVRSIFLPVSYDQPDLTRDEIGRALDAGFAHVVLGLSDPYPAGVAQWVTDELINTSGSSMGC